MLDLARGVLVGLVDHERADTGLEEAGHARRGRLSTELDEEPVGRALQSGSRHDRRHGHDRVAARRQHVRHARNGEDRPYRHDRVRRCDHDELGRLERFEHAGRRRRLLGSVEADRAHDDRVAQLHEVVLEGHLLAVLEPQPGPHRVVAHREETDAEAERRVRSRR